MNHVAGAQKKTTDALVSLACTWRVNERLDIAVLFVFRPHRAGAATNTPPAQAYPYVCARVHSSARTEIAHLHMHSFCICMTRQNDTSWHLLLARVTNDCVGRGCTVTTDNTADMTQKWRCHKKKTCLHWSSDCDDTKNGMVQCPDTNTN